MECWYIRYRGETLGIDNRCSWYRRADALNAFLASDQWLDYKDELIQQIRKESGDLDAGALDEKVALEANKALRRMLSDGTLQINSYISETYS